MRRPLGREVVAGIVQTIIGPHAQTPHGFEWERPDRSRWRLQSGGGIAGNSRVWWLVERAGSKPKSLGPLTTVRALRLTLLEHIAPKAKKTRPPTR